MTRFSNLITVAPLALSLAVASSAIAGTPAPEHDACSYSSRPLIAGQHIDVGDVVVTQDGNQVCVSFEITEDGWYLVETHISVVTDVADFPRNSNDGPAIGHFPMGTSHSDQETSYEACVTLDDLGCNADAELFIAAHASVERYHDGCVQQETAWGNGVDFGGGSWAMYFSHGPGNCQVECSEDEVLDECTNTCVKRCDADHVWNAGTESCDARCPANESWNGHSCECPEGQARNAETAACEIVCAEGEELVNGSCVAECAKDETRDAATGTCKRIACLDGEVLVNDICEKQVVCADDESYVEDSNSCIAKCDGDMVWFEDYGECYEVSVTGGGCSATGTSPNGAAALFFIIGALVLWRRRRTV
jgi:MYXO-CTERM domain-containing protein